MRRKFVELLSNKVKEDPSIVLITADLGFGLFDKFQEEFPNNFINVGSCEQLMMQVAVGLALSGKKPITYTISPFYWRCAEMIRNYVDHESLPILMVGSGVGKDYSHDGFSHDASDIINLMRCLHIPCLQHFQKEELEHIFNNYYKQETPCYLGLKR